MEAGITGKQTITVTEEKTAQAMGSGTLPVFATPAMIALMENTAYKSVADELEEGAGTVGTLMNVKHVAATPVGMEVTCETKLIEVDRKRLVFEIRQSLHFCLYFPDGRTGRIRCSRRNRRGNAREIYHRQ